MGSRVSIASMITTNESPRKKRVLSPAEIETHKSEGNTEIRHSSEEAASGQSADPGYRRQPMKSSESSSYNTTQNSSSRSSRQNSVGLTEAAQSAERHRTIHRSLFQQHRSAATDLFGESEREVEDVESLEVPSSPSAWSNTASSQRPDETLSRQSASGQTRGREYCLTVVSVPVQCTTSGPGFCAPPLIAQLSVKSASDAASSPSTATWITPGTSILVEDDLPHLRVNVSLWDSNGTNEIKFHGAESVSVVGPISVTGQLYKDPQGSVSIFFFFPDLQITRSGSWKVGLSLVGNWPTSEVGAAQPIEILKIKCDVPTLAVPELSPLAVGSVQMKPEVKRLLAVLEAQGAQC